MIDPHSSLTVIYFHVVSMSHTWHIDFDRCPITKTITRMEDGNRQAEWEMKTSNLSYIFQNQMTRQDESDW